MLKNIVRVSLIVILLSGCSMQQLVVDKVGDSLSREGDVFASDPDLELVGAATPFGLKLTESLIAASPHHRGLLLAAARGYTQYAYAFVELPADELEERDVAAANTERERAHRLYLRGRDYGLRGLDAAHPGFAAALIRDPAAAVQPMTAQDVPLLHWTAISWAAAISLAKDDIGMLAGLAPMREMARRALELDESYAEGAIHTFQMSLAMASPQPVGERTRLAQSHFDRAIALSAGHQAAPYVAYAESVAIPLGRRSDFDHALESALRVDGASAPSSRLSNELFQRRARWLRAHAERFFSE